VMAAHAVHFHVPAFAAGMSVMFEHGVSGISAPVAAA
jgi:hypothetical protein